MTRWPFFLGDLLLLLIALLVLLTDGPPPGIGAIVVAVVCVAAGIGLLLVPYMLDYEARLRVAEAAVRETTDSQARRLVQTTEQLAHAVSRSQSTEEQAGQALGALEELADKLSAQAEELAQTLSRSSDREQAELKALVDRLTRERDEQLASLSAKIAGIASVLRDVQTSGRQVAAAQTKAVEDIHLRLDALGARIGEIAGAKHEPPLPSATSVDGAVVEPTPATTPPPASPEPLPPPEPVVEPASVPFAGEAGAKEEESTAVAPPDNEAEPKPGPEVGPEPEREEKRRARRASESPKPAAVPPTARRAKPTPEEAPELPLEGMPPPRPPMKLSRRELAGSTSLVATAYIGIGNKLYLRGDGPGLSWERGVAMQFLAIGKWGWTTPDAAGPVTCRIFRNDETPMMDEDIVVAPGEKVEVTPRF
jgi:outer membrane biosynthesis protein TonB